MRLGSPKLLGQKIQCQLFFPSIGEANIKASDSRIRIPMYMRTKELN